MRARVRPDRRGIAAVVMIVLLLLLDLIIIGMVLASARDQDLSVDRLNTVLLALASYNAGQTRIRRLRRETADAGLDPNVWFDNVEMAVAREIGRETVQYVSNVYKYYLAFRRVEANRARRAESPD